MEHTPGPWIYHNPDEWTHNVVTCHGVLPDGDPNLWTIADANIRRDEASANARLIAAAPEMLEALQACVEMLDHAGINTSLGYCCCGDPMEGHAHPMIAGHTPVDHGDYVASQAVTKARAALSKATGKS